MASLIENSKLAACHPDRKVLASGMCSACYQQIRRRTRHIDPPEGEDSSHLARLPIETTPVRTPGVLQHAYVTPPSACPHCHATFVYIDGRELSCPGWHAGCGWRGYLVKPDPVVCDAL